jgi:DNA-directed RNA polymerase subunit M/transcription elongation factor TFIIS
MVKASACDRCGYRPRTSDAQEIEVSIPDSDDEEELQTIVHVVCYNCGHEWVE